MNIFEGSRRVAKVIAGLLVIVALSIDHTLNGVLFICEMLFVFWIFTWTTGWIVRGFMGIPTGTDKKVSADE